MQANFPLSIFLSILCTFFDVLIRRCADFVPWDDGKSFVEWGVVVWLGWDGVAPLTYKYSHGIIDPGF